jgi:hypothetical protein
METHAVKWHFHLPSDFPFDFADAISRFFIWIFQGLFA